MFERLITIYIPVFLGTHSVSHMKNTGPRRAVSNVSGYRCVSDCNSRGRDPGPVPYFRGD